MGRERGQQLFTRLRIGALYCDEFKASNIHVVAGIWDYLKTHGKGSTMYVFENGPSGLLNSDYMEYNTSDYESPADRQMLEGKRGRFETQDHFRNAENTVRDLHLDGLVFIGGDDATINAYLLDEDFRSKKVKTCVICCPNTLPSDTIDTDLDWNQLPYFCGFDNVCKVYSEMIDIYMKEAQSRGDYQFVRLTGRAASHITLECALQTCPNIALIGEELIDKKLTLKDVRDQIVDVICQRSELGYNYGVILIPEGLIYFIPEVKKLFAELRKIMFNEDCSCGYFIDWAKKLPNQSLELMKFLPHKTQKDVLRRSDPVGYTVIPDIDIEWTLIQVVKTELEKRKNKGLYKGDFKGLPRYIRCMQPSIMYTYCYKLGYAAGELIWSGRHGLMCSVENPVEPVDMWRVSLTPLADLVVLKMRNGKLKPVIKKAMVELNGDAFKRFEAARHIWAIRE